MSIAKYDIIKLMHSKKILIIEDEKPMANALVLKLNSAGFETILVHDGKTALSVLRESSFDLIILDLVLPQKDGFFVLEELKKMKIATPVVISSNLSQEEDIRRARELGARDYFVKSETTLADVVERVKHALREPMMTNGS